MFQHHLVNIFVICSNHRTSKSKLFGFYIWDEILPSSDMDYFISHYKDHVMNQLVEWNVTGGF